MPAEEPAQMSGRHPQRIREVLDALAVVDRNARETVAAAPCHAGVPGAVSGRHRKQGRKPARSAAAAVGKKTTLRDLAGFTGQVGRQ